MRAGKLKMKRYPMRNRGGRWALLLLLGILLGAGAVTFGKQAWKGAVLPQFLNLRQFSAAQTTEPVPREERTLTLPGHTWYALQLGAFDSVEAAESLAASFRSRGAAGYVCLQGQYRVLAAAYDARADAQAVMTQLRANHQVDAVLTEIAQPEVKLRLTGRQDQLTALSDAYDALEQLSVQLTALSDGLDRGKTDRQQTISALQSHRDTLTALKARINAMFGEKAPGSVKDVSDMLDALAQSLNDALAAQGTAALGGRIKYAQLQCLCRMADHAEGLSK
ncbi:MAG: SPOR domain-containing protein [Clostridia bacterium]|nr:SPOR domain-containing protein [Clostridia bacterium]